MNNLAQQILMLTCVDGTLVEASANYRNEANLSTKHLPQWTMRDHRFCNVIVTTSIFSFQFPRYSIAIISLIKIIKIMHRSCANAYTIFLQSYSDSVVCYQSNLFLMQWPLAWRVRQCITTRRWWVNCSSTRSLWKRRTHIVEWRQWWTSGG